MTYEEFREDAKPFLGQLVLIYFEVVLLLDTTQDHYDYYYICIHEKRKEVHHTGVCNFYPLKGRLPDDQYNELVRVWNLNSSEEYQIKSNL